MEKLGITAVSEDILRTLGLFTKDKKYNNAAVGMIKRYYQYEEISGIERKRIDLIPENAYREAIVNSLIHRDWSINSHIRILMFQDRIEIKSSGGPKGITADEYVNGDISYNH